MCKWTDTCSTPSTICALRRFTKPLDGLPVLEDWLGTFESMLFGGIEMTREPLDGSMQADGGRQLFLKVSARDSDICFLGISCFNHSKNCCLSSNPWRRLDLRTAECGPDQGLDSHINCLDNPLGCFGDGPFWPQLCPEAAASVRGARQVLAGPSSRSFSHWNAVFSLHCFNVFQTVVCICVVLINPGFWTSEFTFGADQAWQSFRNLSLSYRGSERQAPNTLQLSLRFSHVMELRSQDGTHGSGLSTEQRLQDVVQSFNETSGLQNKHKIDEEKFKAIYNIIAGSCPVIWWCYYIGFVPRMFVFQGWGFRFVFKSWGWWSFRDDIFFLCSLPCQGCSRHHPRSPWSGKVEGKRFQCWTVSLCSLDAQHSSPELLLPDHPAQVFDRHRTCTVHALEARHSEFLGRGTPTESKC